MASFMGEKGTRLTYSDDVLNLIAERSYSEKFGARNIRRFIEREIEDKIANIVIANSGAKLLGIHLTVENGKIQTSSI